MRPADKPHSPMMTNSNNLDHAVPVRTASHAAAAAEAEGAAAARAAVEAGKEKPLEAAMAAALRGEPFPLFLLTARVAPKAVGR